MVAVDDGPSSSIVLAPDPDLHPGEAQPGRGSSGGKAGLPLAVALNSLGERGCQGPLAL